MATVELQQVRKVFDGAEVVRGVDLEIEDREFLVILGPSGCGKTTLLRMIAGLESVSAGSILFDGVLVNHLPPRARNIAMVFQNYALYAHMSCFDNIAFNLRLRRIPAGAIHEQVERVATLLNLVPLLSRRPFALSGGQRQRVAMGRALVRDPDVFLFDEPLSNLDAKLRVQMRTEIRSIHQRLKTTTIYVTHDQIEALALADRVVVMSEGQIAQIGSPLTVYDQPANRFVASFLGSPSMNFLIGKIGADGVVAAGGTVLPMPGGIQPGIGREITYGVRPEDVTLVAAGEGSPATVEVVEPTGTGVQIYTRFGGEALCVVVAGRPIFRPGEVVHLRPDVGRVHLFDPESGERIST